MAYRRIVAVWVLTVPDRAAPALGAVMCGYAMCGQPKRPLT
jgi:hypothetical protein